MDKDSDVENDKSIQAAGEQSSSDSRQARQIGNILYSFFLFSLFFHNYQLTLFFSQIYYWLCWLTNYDLQNTSSDFLIDPYSFLGNLFLIGPFPFLVTFYTLMNFAIIV